MSKKKRALDMEDLGQMKGELSLQLPSLDDGPSIMSEEEARHLQQGLEEKTVVYRQKGEKIGEDLCSEKELLELMMSGIRAYEKFTVERICSAYNEAARRRLADAYILGMAMTIPESSVGLNHLADQGMAVSFFSRGEKKDSRTIQMPLTGNDDEQHDAYLLFPRGDDYREAEKRVRRIAAALDRQKTEAKEEELERLREGAGELLPTLEAGEGEATFYVPPNRARGWPDCHLRVRVTDGKIFPVAIITTDEDIHYTVEEVIELGVHIPTSIGERRIQLDHYVNKQKLFNTLLAFHRLCHRGWKYAQKRRQREEQLAALKARATVDRGDFLLEKVVGLAHLFLKEWTMVTGEGEDRRRRVFHHVHFLVQRDEEGRISVAETMPGLEELFGEDCREPADPGEKFEGVPQPLQAILRKAFAIARTQEKRNKAKAAAEEQEKTPASEAETPPPKKPRRKKSAATKKAATG